MPLQFGTAEWADALVAAINHSSEYRNAGAKWGVGWNGNLLLTFDPDASAGAPVHLFVKLGGGRCDAAMFVRDRAHPERAFALRAPLALWREILAGKTLAATAILTGALKVEGDVITLLKHAGAHRALLHCVASLDTHYPNL